MHKLTRFVSLLLALIFAISPMAPALAQQAAAPEKVVIPGTIQSELGCPGDWMPDCDQTALAYDEEDDVWQGTFEVQPGSDQDNKGPRYKAALNGSWDENYGTKAQRGGADIPLVVPAATQVKFYYDHKSHWVTDNINTPIYTLYGDFQSELGCKQDNDPACLRSWLQDPQASGTYAMVTKSLPPGTYSAQIGQNEQAIPDSKRYSFTVEKENAEVYFGFDSTQNELNISTQGAPRGSLAKQQAHWLNRATLVWNVAGSPLYKYYLHYAPLAGNAPRGGLEITPDGVTGGESFPLTYIPRGPGDAAKNFPHLRAFSAFELDPKAQERAAELLKGQLAVSMFDRDGKLVDVTGVQIPGVLDDLYAAAASSADLGLVLQNGVPSLHVWAPTAQSVALQLFDTDTSATAQTLPMTLDPASGIWNLQGQAGWIGKYYLYEVTVFAPSTGKFEKNLVTDPYSISLAANSTRSQIIDLNDPLLKPDGWDSLAKPTLDAPEDIVVYELHIRDFSIFDETVPAEHRGKYLAFTDKESNGMKHLRGLAEAGLTHIHLLPTFDIASINEIEAERREPDLQALASLPPDSEQQQAIIQQTSGDDGFNWGYDPYHYSAPEGSYATDPSGSARIKEFRQMVMGLNQTGLRVVMDVVYNHTNSSGQDAKSVLDRVVPGYYHRLNNDGQVENSTCCSNTASEHAMMEKLLIDSVRLWATAYKVDGFRFDLMGHHMRSNMVRLRETLDGLTPQADGVDGKAIYVYGEGWDFGEVGNNGRGVNASQANIGGTGIGAFNDRLRDAVRGGTPFGDPREQGFATGLFFSPNQNEYRSPEEQRTQLKSTSDWIRITLAGGLREYTLITSTGMKVRADQVLYSGHGAGYTLDPQENVVYVSAHDNETIFDVIQLKAPASATLQDRIRMNNLALSLVAFAQGVPFFHAGDDLLRSKSLDRNSYNSGDWFNRLDFTYQDNNFGVGLPSEGSDKWDLFRPLLANPALKPSQQEIQFTSAVFREYLQIRKSSPLFRLRTAQDIRQKVGFPNSGPDQIPGLVVMHMMDASQQIVLLFNASPEPVTFSHGLFRGNQLALHPILANSVDQIARQSSFDASAGSFTVPGRSVAVFTGKATDLPTLTPVQVAESTPTPGTASTTESQPSQNLGLILGIGAVAFAAGVAWFLRRRHGAS